MTIVPICITSTCVIITIIIAITIIIVFIVMFIINIQTEVPFGNRNRLVWVNGLLPAFASEIARVLRPKGRAALLMTRAHARRRMAVEGYRGI